jgi:chromosome segregation ATPase
MPPGTLQRQTRKLAEKIDGRDVYAKDLVNDDLDQIDELGDEYDELEHQKRDLARQIREAEDADERKQLRAQARDLTRQQRAMDTQMLGLYVEDKDGNPFDTDTLAAVPVRVQTSLMNDASKKIHGGDEGPTPETSANG